MTYTIERPGADLNGLLFHNLPEGRSGCPGCGWSGATPRHGGALSHECPACEVRDTHEHRATDECEDCGGTCIDQPMRDGRRWGDLRQGDLYRPRHAQVVYIREPHKGTSTLRRAAEKVGRNEPCPCGSAKKWKRCCGRAAA